MTQPGVIDRALQVVNTRKSALGSDLHTAIFEEDGVDLARRYVSGTDLDVDDLGRLVCDYTADAMASLAQHGPIVGHDVVVAGYLRDLFLVGYHAHRLQAEATQA